MKTPPAQISAVDGLTIRRHPDNPILTHRDVPYPCTLLFNAGVVKFQGRYVMVFRNDYGTWGDPSFQGTNLGVATSTDGVHWVVRPKPWLQMADNEVRRIYDPRLSVIDGRCYVCFAMDTEHGVRGWDRRDGRLRAV